MYKFKNRQSNESIELFELFSENNFLGDFLDKLFKKNRNCGTTDEICENILVCGQDLNCGSN